MEENTKKIKGGRGITLIALVITIIVLLILAGVTIASLTGQNGILGNASKAKTQTEIANEKETVELAVTAAITENLGGDVTEEGLVPELNKQIKDEYDIDSTDEGIVVTYRDSKRSYLIDSNGNVIEYELKKPIDPSEVATGGDNTWKRANGTIDIQFLTGTSYNVGQANKPAIDEANMVPVNWDSTNSCWVVTDEAGWDYSYGDTDETKKWANVMLRDTLVVKEGITDAKTATIAEMKGKKVKTEGSMLVWIPRYAYKITYYAESDTDRTGNPVGYSDARGIVDKDGKTPTGMNSPVTSIGVTVGSDNYYRPHPAFESSKTYTQGEWSSKLTGIWMGKFETTKRETDTKITILPNTASYTNQTIGTFYTDAQNLGIANSHMAKNSEWGAMAYLTESKYGRNGTAVTKNEAKVNNIITTGQGAYISNINQSTTNNVYGIYDTVGGAYEYTAGYVADNSQNYGNSFASTTPSDSTSKNNKETSTQYATVYTKTASDSYTENYTANINKVFGDAIIETSTAGTETTSWHSASSYFVGLDSGDYFPFFKRGGGFSSSGAGSFYFNSSGGGSNSYYGFRVCLAVR